MFLIKFVWCSCATSISHTNNYKNRVQYHWTGYTSCACMHSDGVLPASFTFRNRSPSSTLLLTLKVRGPSYLGLTRSISWSLMPRGCFTNVSRALQQNLAKIYNAKNHIYDEYFKLKVCTCGQSMALTTRTKFQLEILTRTSISAIHRFR